ICLACNCTLWRSDPEPTAMSGHRRPANGAQERRSGLSKHIPMPRRLRHRDVALARPVAVLSFQLNKASGLDQPAHHRLAVTVQNRNGLAVRIQDHVTVSIEGKLIQPPRLLQPQPHGLRDCRDEHVQPAVIAAAVAVVVQPQVLVRVLLGDQVRRRSAPAAAGVPGLPTGWYPPTLSGAVLSIPLRPSFPSRPLRANTFHSWSYLPTPGSHCGLSTMAMYAVPLCVRMSDFSATTSGDQ